jgi:CRP-like cAMP-binding protein
MELGNPFDTGNRRLKLAATKIRLLWCGDKNFGISLRLPATSSGSVHQWLRGIQLRGIRLLGIRRDRLIPVSLQLLPIINERSLFFIAQHDIGHKLRISISRNFVQLRMATVELIPTDILKKYGAVSIKLKKGEILFQQSETATNFFIVEKGKVKMAHYTEQGREFVQGYFTDGQSFGEPPFFNHTAYPASAVAVVNSAIWKIGRESFLTLLRDHFEVHLRLTESLSDRLVYKSMMLSEVAVEEAEHRLTTLINHFKKSSGLKRGEIYSVPFTRQQLADLTGLRVETVIRTIKAMEDKGKLNIEEGRILWR